jgi:hypothetical protein
MEVQMLLTIDSCVGAFAEIRFRRVFLFSRVIMLPIV